MILFENRYAGGDNSSFIDSVNSTAYKLGVDPNWLMYVFFKESGLNPSATNNYYTYSDGSHAVGLNQMTTKAFQEVGYPGTWEDFRNLSGTDQMDWIYKYFKPYAGRINNFKDLYLINFYPAYLGKDLTTQFPYSVVRANPAFDTNGDGQLTLGEFYDYLDSKARMDVPGEYLSSFFDPNTNQTAQWGFTQTHQRDIVIVIFAIIIIAIIITTIYFLAK